MQCQCAVEVLIVLDLVDLIIIYLISLIKRKFHTNKAIQSAWSAMGHLHIKSEAIETLACMRLITRVALLLIKGINALSTNMA